MSLLISPVFGFGLTIIFMILLKRFVKKKEMFTEPEKGVPPPAWIRGTLIATCSGVSFFHGSNDGQKGVGLVMLILIGLAPGYFSLNEKQDPSRLVAPLDRIEMVMCSVPYADFSKPDRERLERINDHIASLTLRIRHAKSYAEINESERFNIRKDILFVVRETQKLSQLPVFVVSERQKEILEADFKLIKGITDYAPQWVVVLISLSLGLGTMIGWKRIVVTVGEKIGKEHLSYAQGASAELVAASTIGLSTGLSLPVSTTHVLSSGIAGSMVASKGIANLQGKTVKNIVMAWILTLPVTVFFSGILFLLLRKLL